MSLLPDDGFGVDDGGRSGPPRPRQYRPPRLRPRKLDWRRRRPEGYVGQRRKDRRPALTLLMAALTSLGLVGGIGAAALIRFKTGGPGDAAAAAADTSASAGSGAAGPLGEPTASQESPASPTGSPSPAGIPPEPELPVRDSRFVHPGVLITRSQLDDVKRRVNAGAQPWAEAFRVLRQGAYGNLSWSPQPRAVVECGAYSQPDLGCTDQWRDASAAYGHALLWHLTGDRRHAQKSAQIIDAWSAVLRDHTGANAQLQAAEATSQFVRAAEILRHTSSGWSNSGILRAESMFRDVLLPEVSTGGPLRPNGNWNLIALNATLGVAVFLDDEALFDRAVGQWRARLPAFIYLGSDGAAPVAPPNGYGSQGQSGFWHQPTSFVDGLTQETCRDLEHTGWGLAALSQFAETAWIQGLDLWAEARPRMVAALELHSRYSLGDPVPPQICGGSLNSRLDPIPELAYNHYAVRQGISLPRTRQYVEAGRPQTGRHFYGWETLTSTPLTGSAVR